MRHMNLRRVGAASRLLPVAGLLASANTALAQWTATSLTSTPISAGSHGMGIGSAQQAGNASTPNGVNAIMWSGTAASVVNLHSIAFSGPFESRAFGAHSGQQVGFSMSQTDFMMHASLWTGSAASFVDLAPAGSGPSVAFAAFNGQQGGYAGFGGGALHAAMWSGTSASVVDLHPGGDAIESRILAMCAGRQAGEGTVGGQPHAYAWTGTAASGVDLNPAGAELSDAYGVDGTHIVGYALLSGHSHAIVWTGTPASASSFVDLHPSGAVDSILYGVHNGEMVGAVNLLGNTPRAAYWASASATWTNLHAILPANYRVSSALGIWHDAAGATFVIGEAVNNTTGRYEAMLWTKPAPPCAADLDNGSGAGTPDGGVDVNDLLFFLAVFELGSVDADLDNGSGTGSPDGGVDINDLLFFLAHFEAGC